MTYSKQGYAASVKYKAEKIKRVPLDMQISFYDEIKAAADQAGESVNGFIKAAIRARLAADPAGAVPVQAAAPLPQGGVSGAVSAGVTSICTSEQEKRVSEKSEKSKKG